MITDRKGSLPLDLSPFIGRDDLLATVITLLHQNRLITLTGPGGTGKTRLALRAAATTGHARIADLGTLGDPDGLWDHLAFTLGVHHHGTAGPDTIAAHLTPRPTLLILDTCDEVVPQAAAAATALLHAAPRLRILATSRQRLGIDGEHTIAVPPLTVPDAARLFTTLATAAGVTPAALADQARVEELCRHLDGLPLAVKLAAGRARTMSLPELIERTTDRFDLLTGLQRVVDLSYRLCTPAEQRLWAATSVFAGPFTTAAAHAVAGDPDTAATIDGLVDKSVLIAATDTHPARFTMLDTLREYGRRTLSDPVAARNRHRDHYRSYLAGAATGWYGPGELDVMAGVHRELPDIVTAVDHSLQHGDIVAARALCRDLVRTRTPFFAGFLDLVLTRLQRVLADPDPTDRAATAGAAAWIAATQGRPALSRELLPAAGDDPFAAGATAVLLDADPTVLPALDKARAAGGGDGHMATMMWAIGSAFAAPPADAAAATAAYLAEAEQSGAPWAVSWALWTAALAAQRAGDLDRATGLLNRCLHAQRSMNDQWGQTWSIQLAAWTIAARLATDPDPVQARRGAWLLGAGTARRKRLGVDLSGLRPFADSDHRAHTAITGILGEDATTTEITAGRQGHQHAIRIALDEPVSRRASSPPGGGLTTREREIAGLVAAGLTSPKIALRLRISARTVDTHIRNISAKLGLANRAAIAAWAAGQ
ncbi:MAG TPA: LuxR C-terminal-related transcriptional regulator [Actinoplanes sp.]|nr:LuxR C-terminal-related transcriptional regulator [Actinoplanes sp.]